jgi:hypothetical protein
MAEPPKPIPASELEAKEFYKRLFTQIRAFEANHLEHKQELYLTTPNAPGLRIFEIGKHGEAFYLAGIDSERRVAMVIRHYTQLSVVLTAVPPPKGGKPRQIGFLDEGKQQMLTDTATDHRASWQSGCRASAERFPRHRATAVDWNCR